MADGQYTENVLLSQGVVLCGGLVEAGDRADFDVPLLMVYGNSGPLLGDPELRRSLRDFYLGFAGEKHWIELPGESHRLGVLPTEPLFQACLAGWIERLPR